MRPRSFRLISVSLLAAAISGGCAHACSGESTPGSGSGESPAAPLTHGLTAEQAGETLVKVGTRTITVGEFAEEIARKGPFLRARYNSPERRRELLDQMIRFELLAQAADAEGFDEHPEVERTRKQVLIRRFLKTQFEDRIQPTDITDAEVQAYYEAHRSEFNKPEQVRVSHILIRNRATAQRVLRQLLENQTDIQLFRELAERHNEDPATRERYGDLRYISRPEERTEDEVEVPAALANAAFAIPQIGGVHAELVESEQGFHIVKLTGRRAALSRTVDEVSRPIRHRLWRERREAAIEELVTRLRSEADVEEHLEVLSDVRIEAPSEAEAEASVPRHHHEEGEED